MTDDEMSGKRRILDGAADPRPPAPATARPNGKIDPIAIGLKQLFSAVADEPIPDEFMALLDRIDANERARDAAQPHSPAPETGSSGGSQ